MVLYYLAFIAPSFVLLQRLAKSYALDEPMRGVATTRDT
jgi:hypothetical protein